MGALRESGKVLAHRTSRLEMWVRAGQPRGPHMSAGGAVGSLDLSPEAAVGGDLWGCGLPPGPGELWHGPRGEHGNGTETSGAN